MRRASPTSSDGKNSRSERFRTEVSTNSPRGSKKGGSYVWVANGSGRGCGAPGSCAADGDDCGRQNLSQGRTARSAHRVGNGRDDWLHRQGGHHVADGTDVQGPVTAADVVGRGSPA